jgi:PAS domain S-box-containing protein
VSGTSSKTKLNHGKETMKPTGKKKGFQNNQSYNVDGNSFTIQNLSNLLNQKYQDLYEKTPCLLRTVSLDGIIFACNELYAKKLGYQKSEVIGKSIFEHTAENSIKQLESEIDAWKVTREIANVEIWMKRKDGSIFPVLLNGASLFDENKKLIGRTVVLVDLTEIYKARKMINFNQEQIKKQFDELKQSNTLLVKTEQKYRNLYENSPDLLRTINLEGMVLDCNNSYCKYLGYTKKEIVRRSVFDFVATRSNDAYMDSFETWRKTGKVSNTKVWFKRKDGTEFLGLINANNLYDFDGKLVGSNTTIRDISDLYEIRKTLEGN